MEYLKEFMVIYTIFLMGAVSPGPDFIMIVRNSTGFGSKIGFKTALGISIGCLITLSYILVGVGAVFNQFPILKEIDIENDFYPKLQKVKELHSDMLTVCIQCETFKDC